MTAPRIPEWIRYVPPEVARKMLSALAKLGIDNHPPAALVERIAMESGGDDLLIERIHSALVVADAHEDREKEGQKHMKPPAKHSTPTVQELCDPAFTLPDPAPRPGPDCDDGALFQDAPRYVSDAERTRFRSTGDTLAGAYINRANETIEMLLTAIENGMDDRDLRALAAQVRGKGRHR